MPIHSLSAYNGSRAEEDWHRQMPVVRASHPICVSRRLATQNSWSTIWFYIFQYGISRSTRRSGGAGVPTCLPGSRVARSGFAVFLASVVLLAFYSNCEDFSGRLPEFARARSILGSAYRVRALPQLRQPLNLSIDAW